MSHDTLRGACALSLEPLVVDGGTNTAETVGQKEGLKGLPKAARLCHMIH